MMRDQHNYVPNLHRITMQPVDWTRWCNGCFQAWIRLGRATMHPDHIERGKRKRQSDVDAWMRSVAEPLWRAEGLDPEEFEAQVRELVTQTVRGP